MKLFKKLTAVTLAVTLLLCFAACSKNETAPEDSTTNITLNEESFIKDLKSGLEARWALGSRSSDLQSSADSVNAELKYLRPYENITFEDSYYENIRKNYMEALMNQNKMIQNADKDSFMSTEDDLHTWDDTTYARYKIIVELYDKTVLDVPSDLIDLCKNDIAVYEYGYEKFYEDLNESANIVEDDNNKLLKATNPMSVDLHNASLYLSAYGMVGEGDDADYEYLGEVNIEKIELWKAGEEICIQVDSEKYDSLTAYYKDATLYISFVC